MPEMKKTCTHQPDCLKLIQRIIDREASPEEEAAFLVTKDQCLPCQEGYELEKSLRKAIKSTCSTKCPEELFARIKAKLFAVLILISILIPLFC
jgi:anti-sigma factor (TIGR02949 family)